MKFRLSLPISAVIGLIGLVGCGRPDPTLLPPAPPGADPTLLPPATLSATSESPDEFEHGPIYIDEAELILLESLPVQVELIIRGALPTPCASLEWSFEPPDEHGRIEVEAFSLQDPALDCIQVLGEMEKSLPLGSYSSGSYSVWLNGELVGEFDV
ncbi:MAG: hypothetical protein ACE5JF_07490 [Anaerolineales bacterium]